MTSVLGIHLPGTWSSAPLKHVTELVNRGSAPEYIDVGPVRVVSQAANQSSGIDWDRTRYHNYGGNPEYLKGFLRPRDILVNSTGTGTLGRIGYFQGPLDERPCMADGHVTVVRTSAEQLDSRFAYYWLSSIPFGGYLYAALVVGATNQIELNRDRLRDAPVPLPPLEEQRRIADFLDAETSRIDRIIEAMNQQDVLMAERRSRLLDLVSESLVAKGTLRLGYVADLVTSGSRGWSEFVSDSGDIFFRSANLRRDNLAPRMDNLVRVSLPADATADGRRAKIEMGDVLVGITGANAGWVALADKSVAGGYVSQHVGLIRPDRRIYGPWLAALISSPSIQNVLMGSQYGGTKTQLSLPDLRGIRVPVVDIAEQIRAAQAISNDARTIDRQRMLRKRQLGLISERRQALIAAAVTGQFDVTTASGRNVTPGV